ncbi:MAG: hypothetical protein N2Z57_09490, partial [Oscillospiraceae bacterium]|nr:hypothetical protein [Oscillospiraceae bacterium]
NLVHEALLEADRKARIGFRKKCLIRPNRAGRLAEKRRNEKTKNDKGSIDKEKRLKPSKGNQGRNKPGFEKTESSNKRQGKIKNEKLSKRNDNSKSKARNRKTK